MQLNNGLKSWANHHRPLLMWSAVQALSLALPGGRERTETHLLHVSLAPRTDHAGNAGKLFRVVRADVVEVKVLRDKGGDMAERMLAGVERMRAELVKSKSKGGAWAVAAVVLVCANVCQAVPVGLTESMERVPVEREWKAALMGAVEDGKKM